MAGPRMLAASLILAAGAVGFAPASSAGQVVVGVGIGFPGFAIAAPLPVAIAPPAYYYGPAYYGPAYYGPAVVRGPFYGYGYYGRPYTRYVPRVYAHGHFGRPYYPH
jgi:hypothetical protein